MRHVDITATPSGDGWLLRADGVPEVAAVAHSLSAAEVTGAAAVAAAVGAPLSDVEVTVTPVLEDDVRQQVIAHAEVARELAALEHRATQATEAAARALVEAGLSRRDAAIVLRVSYLRVCQLVGSDERIASIA